MQGGRRVDGGHVANWFINQGLPYPKTTEADALEQAINNLD